MNNLKLIGYQFGMNENQLNESVNSKAIRKYCSWVFFSANNFFFCSHKNEANVCFSDQMVSSIISHIYTHSKDQHNPKHVEDKSKAYEAIKWEKEEERNRSQCPMWICKIQRDKTYTHTHKTFNMNTNTYLKS